VAWDVEDRKPPMLLCMGLKICLDEDFHGFLAGVHFHSDRVIAKIYLMPTTVLASNISMILSSIDQQTKKFTEPPEQIKQQIAAVQADNSAPEEEKREDLAQLEAALKDTKPIQFKENIALVLKYFDELTELMQEQGPAE
jgi:hypothetical protein